MVPIKSKRSHLVTLGAGKVKSGQVRSNRNVRKAGISLLFMKYLKAFRPNQEEKSDIRRSKVIQGQRSTTTLVKVTCCGMPRMSV